MGTPSTNPTTDPALVALSRAEELKGVIAADNVVQEANRLAEQARAAERLTNLAALITRMDSLVAQSLSLFTSDTMVSLDDLRDQVEKGKFQLQEDEKVMVRRSHVRYSDEKGIEIPSRFIPEGPLPGVIENSPKPWEAVIANTQAVEAFNKLVGILGLLNCDDCDYMLSLNQGSEQTRKLLEIAISPSASLSMGFKTDLRSGRITVAGPQSKSEQAYVVAGSDRPTHIFSTEIEKYSCWDREVAIG